MSYRELFSSVNCKCVIIIEDDFEQRAYTKERALYDIARMAIEDRNQYLEEIEGCCPEMKGILSDFLSLFDECFDEIGKWDDKIPRGDIGCVFPQIEASNPTLKGKIEEKYNLFEGEVIHEIYELGAKYGIGVDPPPCFADLYNNYILCDNRAKSLRIYTDFSAKTQEMFIDNIKQASKQNAVVCIVDNNLAGVNRAKEIIDIITQECNAGIKNIIGSIFSSKEKFEEINDKLYFEYTSKNNPEQLKACIAKSAYNYFISELKEETIFDLSQAFDKAMKNKGIAFFLAQKAQVEGISEYEIINDWIGLLSTTSRTDTDTIKRMICLSRVINSLDDSDELPDTDLQKLNTLEAFDYTINDYLLPVAAGDVFTNSYGEWFVLVGQDCDMARSIGRAPKNALAELLPAKIRPQTEFSKWANDLEKASIYSFKESLNRESAVLQVEYKKRLYIANEILNLCAFNADGQCKLSLSESLPLAQKNLIPNYMVDYYEMLQKFFLRSRP